MMRLDYSKEKVECVLAFWKSGIALDRECLCPPRDKMERVRAVRSKRLSLMWSAFGPRDKVECVRTVRSLRLSLTESTLESKDKVESAGLSEA